MTFCVESKLNYKKQRLKDFIDYLKDYWPLFVSSVLLCVPAIFNLIVNFRKSRAAIIVLTVVFWISVYFINSSAANTFMYFKF